MRHRPPDQSARAVPAVGELRHNRYPMIILLSLLVAIIGVLVYVLASNPKIAETGRILFFAGMFVTLLRMGPASISFPAVIPDARPISRKFGLPGA